MNFANIFTLPSASTSAAVLEGFPAAPPAGSIHSAVSIPSTGRASLHTIYLHTFFILSPGKTWYILLYQKNIYLTSSSSRRVNIVRNSASSAGSVSSVRLIRSFGFLTWAPSFRFTPARRFFAFKWSKNFLLSLLFTKWNRFISFILI